MATLNVQQTTNFSNQNLNNIDTIDFDNLGAGATATFASSQFDNTHISRNVHIDGNLFVNNIVVNATPIAPQLGATLSAAGWSFFLWDNGVDSITIRGTSLVDLLIGSSQSDIIIGGEGRDALHGGGGNDTFVYNAPSDLVAGELIDGGAGADTIRVQGSGTFDFSAATLSSVEQLQFLTAGPATVSLDTSQIGAIVAVKGGGATDVVAVTGSVIDLSAVTFATWSPTDQIRLTGTTGADSITGSSQADTIFGGDGADVLHGGDGNDFFSYQASTHVSPGEIIDGGAGGQDTIGVSSDAPYDFSLASITGIEQLFFASGLGGSALFSAPQLSAGEISRVLSSPGADTVTVTGSAVDLSGVQFFNWTIADHINLNGTAGNDTFIGSNQADTMTGGGGADTFIFQRDAVGQVALGHDTIVDFAQGQDHVEIDASMFNGFADVQAHLAQVGADAVITFDAGNSITLHNVTAANLAASDFVFV